MGLAGRYFSRRDLKLINSLNGELMGDIIQTTVLVFKLYPDATPLNIYGEAEIETGKVFFPGVEITTLIDRQDIDTPTDDFGTDRQQIVQFRFRENMLKLVNLYPETGDMILFNDRYHEIDNVVQEQFLGGISEKSHSIICDTHYSRLTKLNIFRRS
jgi:hypothetical protein